MKYYEGSGIYISPGTFPAAANYYFSCNSIYDPNRTGTGHQPRGHDELANIYATYVVIYSEIHVTWQPNKLEDGGIACALSITPDTSSGPSTLNDMTEGRSAKFVTWHTDSTNTKIRRQRMKWSLKHMRGSKKLPSRTNFGSNPADEEYFCLSYAGTDSTRGYGMYPDVFIKYVVVCAQPKFLPVS